MKQFSLSISGKEDFRAYILIKSINIVQHDEELLASLRHDSSNSSQWFPRYRMLNSKRIKKRERHVIVSSAASKKNKNL